jgi:ribosome biogenesis GTPase
MTGFLKGIVVATRGRLFEVSADGNRYRCEVRQKVKTEIDSVTPVAVGDDVQFSVSHDNIGTIEQVEERRSAFFRPTVAKESVKQVIAANLDKLAIVGSIKSPKLKTGIIDRFLISAQIGNLQPLIIINKMDLKHPHDLDEIYNAYKKMNFEIFLTSTVSLEGMDELSTALKDHRTLFVGHSGVGKSTIINKLIPKLDLKTGEVSESTSRGVHTTAYIELFELPQGGFVADSPGLKVMGLWDVTKDELTQYYPEFEKLSSNCKFRDCSHTSEPQCAIKEALQKGEIVQFRYDNYLAIAASLD